MFLFVLFYPIGPHVILITAKIEINRVHFITSANVLSKSFMIISLSRVSEMKKMIKISFCFPFLEKVCLILFQIASLKSN